MPQVKICLQGFTTERRAIESSNTSGPVSGAGEESQTAWNAGGFTNSNSGGYYTGCMTGTAKTMNEAALINTSKSATTK